MELASIIRFFKQNIKIILATGAVFAVLGAGLYYLIPVKYYATGSIFIRRQVYPYTEDYFTYEGYYSQQAAVSYSHSVAGIIESADVRAKALASLNKPINEKTLRELSKKMNIKRPGPQLITITIKGKSITEAQNTWEAVATSAGNTISKLTADNDPYISVAVLTDKPVIKEGYRNIFINITAGLTLGLLVSSGALALKSYLERKK